MDCQTGKIDRIITKSISWFARNALDCLNYVRELKGLGIGMTFEKENIDTLDEKGGSAADNPFFSGTGRESEYFREQHMGIRKRFEIGQHKMNTKRFLGYDVDENGKMVVNKPQAKIVKQIFMEFLWGEDY